MFKKILLLCAILTMLAVPALGYTEYTPSSKTDCVQMREGDYSCTTTKYSHTQFVFQDNRWVDVKKAKSLRNSFEVDVSLDEDFNVRVTDFNYTDIIFEGDVSVTKLFRDIKLKLYDARNDSIVFYETNDFRVLPTFKKYHVRSDDGLLGKKIKWGLNSTIITLHDANTEILNDVWIDEASPDTNRNSLGLRVRSDGGIGNTLIQFNISGTAPDVEIQWANLSLYHESENLDPGDAHDLSVHHVFGGFSWDEETLTFNTQPAGGTEYNITAEDTVGVADGQSAGFIDWNVTSALNKVVKAEQNNVSFMLNSTCTSGNCNFDRSDFTDKEDAATDQHAILMYSYLAGSDATPPVWGSYQNQSIDYNSNHVHDLNATDNVAISRYSVNDTTQFNISQSGVLRNMTNLTESTTYILNLTVNDTSNNFATVWYKLTIGSSADTTPPVWNSYQNISLGFHVNLHANVNATDETALDSYVVNDTTQFNISSGGLIQNLTPLAASTAYILNVTANDTSNNFASIWFKITVGADTDTAPPVWSSYVNQSIDYNIMLSYDLDVTDETALDRIILNDTQFNISQSGLVINNTNLTENTDYIINITANDTSNNFASIFFKVSVGSSTPSTVFPALFRQSYGMEWVTINWTG